MYRITEDVFGLGIMIMCRGLLRTLLSPMCYTSAGDLAKQTTCINNLPNQTNDVMVNPQNPENPDSNIQLLRA